MVADCAVVHRSDVPRRLALRNIVSVPGSRCSGEGGRPDEQHWNHDVVQYCGSGGRPTCCKLRPAAGHRLSMESHTLRRGIRFAQHPRDRPRRVCITPKVRRSDGLVPWRAFGNPFSSRWALGRGDSHSGNFSVSTRSSAFRPRESSFRGG